MKRTVSLAHLARNGCKILDCAALPMGGKSGSRPVWPFAEMMIGDRYVIADEYVSRFVRTAVTTYRKTLDCTAARKRLSVETWICEETGQRLSVVERIA